MSTDQLSEHFRRTEMEHGEFIPKEALPSFVSLCKTILEPIRARYGLVIIMSGYRSELHNATVGGVPTSQHIATADHCAADFTIPGADLVEVYDWIRLSSHLPVDQVILEFADKHEISPACIHISYSTTPRYMALEGEVHNRSPYTANLFNHPADVNA